MSRQSSNIRVLASWISEALAEEEQAAEQSGVHRILSAAERGSSPIGPSSLPPRVRPSLPSDLTELSAMLEGDALERCGA